MLTVRGAGVTQGEEVAEGNTNADVEIAIFFVCGRVKREGRDEEHRLECHLGVYCTYNRVGEF